MSTAALADMIATGFIVVTLGVIALHLQRAERETSRDLEEKYMDDPPNTEE